MVGKFLNQRQTNIFSAATIIGSMIAASRVLGLVRNRVLAHFFSAEELSIYFAAFRLPETIFGILVFGIISSAFIPVFVGYLSKKKKKEAWHVASVILNATFLTFTFLALLIFIFAKPLYQLITAGFTPKQIEEVVSLTRILIFAQAFFVLSYFLTGILESFQRFLIPAIAPLFYNLGIILGTILLSNRFGIFAPTLGAVLGSALHLAIQVPFCSLLGFSPALKLDFSHPGVRKIGELAFPRIIELAILEFSKSIELFLASLISTAAYTWFTFASSLQLFPVSLFGTSIAKATLPTLSYRSTDKNLTEFKKIFLSSFKQILFLTIPFSIFLAVLRIPVVRLAFGASRFTWKSTIETSQTLSVFCLSISAQALTFLLARAFYALHQTATAVKASVLSIFLNITLSFLFILIFHFPIWGLALSFSISSICHVFILFYLLNKKINFDKKQLFSPFIKVLFASLLAGSLMFFLLKIFDRSVWDKKLSFLGRYGLALPTTFEHFVLDTHYTINLALLTLFVSLTGIISYLFLAWVFRIEELAVFKNSILSMKNGKAAKTKRKET